ncbi:LppX_LprAFG lipoprotein [Tsukamurella soli]|uniref:LppX_LprAFG lipoprotein n=1 Tax=Tsukamurella soli TaxID=644556 RepID=A0ABP8KA15_9ACTN
MNQSTRPTVNDHSADPRRLRRAALPAIAVVTVSAALLAGCTKGSSEGVSTSAAATSSSAVAESDTGIPSAQGAGSATPAAPVDLKNAPALLEQASQVTKMMHSVHIVMDVSKDVQGVPLQNLTGDVTNQPAVAAQGNGVFRIGDQYVQTKFVVVDGTLYAELTGNTYKNFGQAQKIYDPAVILNKDLGLGHLLESVTAPTVSGEETLAGTPTVRITGTVDSSVVDKIIPSKSQTGGPGTSGSLPITLWITQKAPYSLVQTKITMGKGDVTLQTSNWEKPVTIVKPTS